MDYHIIGFRECASEVARYLVTIEGMDIQDPLRLRLMSHLQCFVAQRELSAKSTAGVASASWSPSSTYQPNYPSQGYQTYPTTQQTPHQQQQNSFNSSYMSTSGSSSSYLNSTVTPQSPEYSSISSGYGTAANASASSNDASKTSPAPHQTSTTVEQQVGVGENQQPIYTDLSNTNDRLANLGGSYHHYSNNQLYGSATNNNVGYNNNNNNNNSKPYRPWHPEMAY
jgi:hairy and enhancer of split related with YRPW motif